MGYTSNFIGNISYERIEDSTVLTDIHDFIHDVQQLDTLVADKLNLHYYKRNQFADNVDIMTQSMNVHISERKSIFFKDFLQEIVNRIHNHGYNVLNVYIERHGENDNDIETFTIVGSVVVNNKSNNYE